MCRPGLEGLFEVVYHDGNQSAAMDGIASIFRYRLDGGNQRRLMHFHKRLFARLARDPMR